MRPLTHCALCMFIFVFGIASRLQAQELSPPGQSLPPKKFAAADTLGRWRLVHVPAPRTGSPLPALLQVADPAQSDPGFIGMMIRCGEKDRESELVPLFVVAEPFPPQAQPQVTLRASGPTIILNAHGIPTGAAVSIPLDIYGQMLGAWHSNSNLSVSIKNDSTTLNGLIRLSGLLEGLNQLATECRRS